ncbi:NAD(P)/FAD-dependent oxidoreductase [Actinobacteria bacterium YIM 96077]|uniref:NAD(P)/FAD-dependent oxidoreductase n=1 Tax=Phytoactinopolyspora halophila TaxID=1981511 RepID=A0A329R2X2_9ACTN|nr:NAD(P)/FAD-dependent oxidoreductase [Actinobacteria bacterium YIM 96077]RAW18994.1 NAD(P)/FAD-dependent oxidoreductase [Phytoactinopolyspora halophila]
MAGHGMAGSRFVQELRARDPEQQLDVTVFGAERDGAYNRVLLSSVLAGSLAPADVEMIPSAWYAAEDVDLRLGVSVESIDRGRQRVWTSQGEYIGYDHLVLATGSQPVVPDIDGILAGDELASGVAVFRTLQDCRDILDCLDGVHRAVVLGGGLLGVEAARGLAGRGVEVEVMHAVDRLMERQLDAEAGQILAGTLRSRHVQVRLDARARSVGEVAGQRVVVLDDGTYVAADLLIIACGVRPDTGLARAAGLDVDRGVVVDDQLTSVTDRRVHAIGECAQYGGETYGLVAPAWEQATVLADVLTGGGASYDGSRLVTRLKAADVDLAAMGETDPEDAVDAPADARQGGGAEVLRFADPARGVYQKIVIRDQRITGAIMLGGAETVGTVTQLFDRAGTVPADRRALIFPGIVDAVSAVDPAELGDTELVCRCNGVSAGDVRHACASGAATVADVAGCTRATTGCGSCRETVAALVATAASEQPDDPGLELVEVPA